MTLLRDTPRTRRWATWLAGLWSAAILVACLWPGEDIPDVDVPLADKWVHFVLFGVLSFLQALAAPARWWAALLLGAAFGAAVEGLQALTHPWLHRYGDVSDWVADLLGTVLGLLLFAGLRRILRPAPGTTPQF